MKYNLYKKITPGGGRAPSTVIMENYNHVGEIEAYSRSEAVRKWYSLAAEETDIGRPEVGDLLEEGGVNYYSMTPQGLWALVKVVV